MKVNFTWSLFALSALGILSGDLELSRATCKELEIQESSKDLGTYVNPATLLLIKCYTAFMQVSTGTIFIMYIEEKLNVYIRQRIGHQCKTHIMFQS